MVAATARVQSSTVPWGDDKIERVTQSGTGTTYYPGQMMARISSNGLADHATDSALVVFDGINAESDRVVVFAGDTPGRPIKIERPWRFVMAIAAAVAGDEGKKVYVVDNQTVGYTSSNSVLVGFVDQVLSATAVLINPLYAPLNPVAVSGNILAFSGATGVDQITFPNNLADALTFATGSLQFLTFVTTTGSEATNVKAPAATSVTSAGGSVTVTAGSGGTTSGTGGSITETAGAGGAGATVGTGGAFSATGGASTGSGAGGSASLVGGAGGLVSTGGAALVTGGAGGATSGNGGAVTITGGAGVGTSGVGGVAGMTGGAGVGASAGGVAKIVGGVGGLTGAGGAAQVTGGAGGGTSGTGGAVTIAAGAAVGTSAVGGAVTITSGASAGASGTAGTVSIDTGSKAGGTGAAINIGDVNTTGTYINRGPLNAIITGLGLTALGTVQSSTPTIAQLLGGVITQSGTSAGGTVTLPTGTAISAGMARTPVVGDSFTCLFSSTTGGQTLTITGQTGSTVVGNPAIAAGKVAAMTFINTGSNAWSVFTEVSA